MALTYVRYYFNKLDNIQREELTKELGVSIETLYRRLKNGGRNMKLCEATKFCDFIEKHLAVRPSIESLTKEIKVEEDQP